MEVIKEKDMKLLSRKRVTLMVENTGATPSRQDLTKEIAKKFKVKEDMIAIKHIYQQFGKNKTKVFVHIYDDKEKMELFEHEDLLKKQKGEEVTKEVEEKPPKPEQQQPKKDGEEAPVAEAKPETSEEKPAKEPATEKKPAEEPVAEEEKKEETKEE